MTGPFDSEHDDSDSFECEVAPCDFCGEKDCECGFNG